MAKDDGIQGAIGRAIDRIEDPRFLAVIVLVAIFAIYSAATSNPTATAITVIVGIGAIVAFSAFDRSSGTRMHVAIDFPTGLKDPNVRLKRSDYKIFGPEGANPKSSGQIHPVLGPGESESYLCPIPREAGPSDTISITLTDEQENQWPVREFVPELSWPRFIVQRPSKTTPHQPLKLLPDKEAGIQLRNFAKPKEIRNGRQYYSWKVFLDAPDNILRQVKEVEYVLHPTFAQPRRIETDSANKFALESSGWGQFTILAHLKFYDGSVQTLSHNLNLHNFWPAQ